MQRSKRDQIGFQTPAFTTHLESAPIGIGIVNDGTIKFANKKLCSMLGYAAKELVGKNLKILYPNKGKKSHHTILTAPKKNRTGSCETQFLLHKVNEICHFLSPSLDPSLPTSASSAEPGREARFLPL